MIGDIVNPYYSYLADGVLTYAKQSGFHVILCAHNENPAMEREYLEVLIQQRVDGVVAVPTGQNIDLWREALELGAQVVCVDREPEALPGVDVVVVDNAGGAFELTNHLIGLGHRRIGIIIGPPLTTTGGGRLQGYREALDHAGITVDRALVRIGTFMRESGREATEALLAMDDRPTAIFAGNNVLGESALFVIRDHGLRIPHDISLGMFDDVPWASLAQPAVTVVAQPDYDLGIQGCAHTVWLSATPWTVDLPTS